MSADDAEEDTAIETAVNRGGTIYSQSDEMRLTGFLIRRVRELSGKIDEQGTATNNLTERIRKLNVWLLVVTVAIFALTLVQIVVALKGVAR